MTSHSTFHAKQCKLNLKRHTSWHQESSRCSCIASQQTLRPWASSNHWQVQAGGLTKIWPWWSWWSNISNVHLQHFQEFATHDFDDCFEQGLNLSSLQSSRYIKRCVSVHSQWRPWVASCFVPGCLPQLFNPVVMPLRFQGSPTLGVSCGRNSETVNSWFKIYLFKMVIFYSYVSLPECISSISPVPGVPGIPGS